jgi:lipopolysaccharide export system protein LptA
MKSLTLHFCFAFCFLIFSVQLAWSQEPVGATDSLKEIQILSAGKLELLRLNDSTQLQILAVKVRLKQDNTIFECDSCVINNRLHLFEAFGRVHINDADTTNLYSDHLRYLTDKKIAYMNGHVKLTDGKAILTTNDLEYDVNTKLGIYTNGGKVVNKKTVITSQEGNYYTEMKDIYFKGNVELNDPAYYLKTDSLLVNTQSEIARFIAQTFIKDSSGRTVTTSDGFYDTKNRKAQFGGRPIIKDGARIITGDQIETDDSTGITQITGNGIVNDSAQNTIVMGGKIISNSKTESFIAFNKPLMIVKQEEDSIYISADTLFSARLTDLYGSKDSLRRDTIKGVKVIDVKNKDSTDRYFEAYYHVRVFSDSLQSICDSLFYSFKDSVFRLYKDPFVWSKESQITGDTILLFTKNKKADRLKVFDNSFLVSQVKGDFFNQVKSARMDGYFNEGSLDSVRARGFAECIYYIQDEDSAFTGINQSTSDAIDIYFGIEPGGKEKSLQKVVFRSAVKGTLWPMRSKTSEEMKLEKFQWMENRRPKTKYELYQ